ncbi:MAG: 50S ribosomal protein L30e [Candidatus Marsarchaeota archaeon]|jgi:large subunit ribosomal protein L30e|nr:50S ribosomal protein L30e [Candidatus Marsarchaeota archaeon]
MSDLGNDIRLVVDTGKVSIGYRNVLRSISNTSANAVVVASKGNTELINDIKHMCNIASVKVITFDGNPTELGALCGKPFSVNALAVLEQGSSKILTEDYGV